MSNARVIINPGSGPVSGATPAQALANTEVFAQEIGGAKIEGPLGTEGDGRWKFRLSRDGLFVEIDMPGIELESVRYLGSGDQNIWDFPRLYVDGGSWVWKYAVGTAIEALNGETP